MRAERRHVLRWVSFCAWFVLVFASRAFAGVERTTIVDDVRVNVRSPWPAMLNHGAQPVLLEFENPHDDARRIELKFSNFGIVSDTVTAHVDVAGNQHARLEVFLPVVTNGASAYTLELRVGGENSFLPGIGASEQAESGVRNVLVISTDPPEATAPVTWTTSLHDEAMPRFTPPTESNLRSFPYRPTGAAPAQVVRANSVLLPDLPTRTEAYSSIDGVVIDTSAHLENDARVAALATWTRLGNVLAFYGRGAEKTARGVADIGPWLERRFLVRDVDGVSVYACGQGLVLVGEDTAPFANAAQIAALNWAMESRGSWIPRIGPDRGDGVVVTLPGLELPLRPLTLLLVLFAILIGPVNFYVVRRMKRPALLLITVPSIALLFSLGLFGYGALAQGLDVRAGSETFTLLDQRAHRSTSAEVRTIFAGLSVGDGLVPGPGASAWRDIDQGDWRRQTQCTIDFGTNVVLGGNFMPVRTPTRQVLLTDRASRARVDVRPDGDGWIVENALGVGIRSILLRDFDGKWFASTDPIAAGQKLRISAGAAPAPRLDRTFVFAGLFDAESSLLPLGSYSALLDFSPFSDDFGVEARQVDPSFHHVVGILDDSRTESKR